MKRRAGKKKWTYHERRYGKHNRKNGSWQLVTGFTYPRQHTWRQSPLREDGMGIGMVSDWWGIWYGNGNPASVTKEESKM